MGVEVSAVEMSVVGSWSAAARRGNERGSQSRESAAGETSGRRSACRRRRVDHLPGPKHKEKMDSINQRLGSRDMSI